MRIKTASLASALLILPCAATSHAAEGRVYYKDGTRIETEDFELKFNVQLQPRYSYEDFDSDRDEEEVSEFSIRRARLGASGHLLDKQFSYMLLNDFDSDGGGSDMKDAWIQWNGMANVRFGQFKVPFTRQYNVSSSKLYFAERADVINTYDRDRDFGAMVHGAAAEDALHWYAGVFNGEGANTEADDTDHRWAGALDFTIGEYGSRGEEGDMDGGEFGATFGATSVYEQDEFEGASVDTFAFTGDAGIRVAGFDLQTEFLLNEIDDDADEPSQWGFYAQAMYTMDKLGFGVRYGYDDPDEVDGIEDLQEISGVFNYFIDGHRLKLQNQISFFEENAVGADSLNDFQYLLQLSGYF